MEGSCETVSCGSTLWTLGFFCWIWRLEFARGGETIGMVVNPKYFFTNYSHPTFGELCPTNSLFLKISKRKPPPLVHDVEASSSSKMGSKTKREVFVLISSLVFPRLIFLMVWHFKWVFFFWCFVYKLISFMRFLKQVTWLRLFCVSKWWRDGGLPTCDSSSCWCCPEEEAELVRARRTAFWWIFCFNVSVTLTPCFRCV